MDFETFGIALKKHRKLLLKCFFYIILFILLIHFYLIDEIINFTKGSTTESSQAIEVENLDAPYINLCYDPPFKPSMLQEHGLPDNGDIGFKYITDVSKARNNWNLFPSLSYEHEKDFSIRMEIKSDLRKLNASQIALEIEQYATYRHGVCYLIKYNESLSTRHGRVRLYFNYVGLAVICCQFVY